MDMTTQFLCGSVDEWQRAKIHNIENNTIKYHDIIWNIDGNHIFDTRQVYAESEFMRALFDSPLRKGICVDDENTPIYTIEEKDYVFNMIRIYFHTGIITYTKGESITRTMERYTAFKFYGVEIGSMVLKTLIRNTLTPINALQAFEYVIHRDGIDILVDVQSYVRSYAFVILRHRNFCNIKRESIKYIIDMCMDDQLNILESDLMTYLYRLCSKKAGDKEFSEFNGAMDIFKHPFGDNGESLWDCIRIDRMSMRDFMEFTQKNPNSIHNDDIVECMSTIYKYESDPVSKKRKTFQVISSYPRDLKVVVSSEPQLDITKWERNKIQVFFVIPYDNSEVVHLPHISAGNIRVICKLHNIDKCLSLDGNIYSDLASSDNMDVNMTVSIVNFRHDRWKKSRTSFKLSNSSSFDIPNILSKSAIEGASGNQSGYIFDLDKYPEYSGDGGKMSFMMYLGINMK